MNNLVKIERPMAAKVLDNHLAGRYTEPLCNDELSALSVYMSALEAANMLLQSQVRNLTNDLSVAVRLAADNGRRLQDIEDRKAIR